MLEPWQEDFVEGLRNGKTEAYLAKTLAGMPLGVIQKMRQDNIAFGRAWEDAMSYANAKAASREMTPIALEKVLHAQIPDERAAAYFGLSLKEFKEKVSSDEHLKRVYDVARDAGLALVEMQIHGEALQGNWQATQHFAKHKLGQSDQATQAPPPVTVTFNISDPAASYRQLLSGGALELPAIDVGGQHVVLVEKEET